jgi:hypothetical protein
MHTYDLEGFEQHEPTARKINCVPKFPIGIHERWAADGHDKLYKIGFPIYAIVDDATGKWLGAWVVPSNRVGEVVAYLVLLTVEKYGGMLFKFTFTALSKNDIPCNYWQAFHYSLQQTADLKQL